MKYFVLITLSVFTTLFCVSIEAIPNHFQDSISSSKKASGSSGKFKSDLKKIEKNLSFKNFFHHNDSAKLAKQYIHEQQKLTKGGPNYLYNIDHENLNLKVEAYKPTTKFKLDYEVFAWYPYWEDDLYKNLNYSLLTTIAYFSYEIEPATGNPITPHHWETTPLIDSAKANGSRILLTVTNFGETNNKKFLNNAQAVETLIKHIETLLKKRKANGVCIDFEGLTKAQKNAYSSFITLLSHKLKKADKNYLIYITVPALDWGNYLDFEVLTPVVDQFVIMGYGYYGSTSQVAGPVDPINSGKIWEPFNLSTSIDYYLANKIPASKLILALPFYGAIWNTESGKIGAKVKSFAGSRTYDYIRTKFKMPLKYDTVSQSVWYSYIVNKKNKQYRQCWFDNDSTIAVKLNLIKKKKLNGMGIWALGYDKGYHDMWRVIADNLSNTKVIADDGDSGSNANNSKTDKNKPTSGIGEKISSIQDLLKNISNYKTLILFTMSFAVVFGGVGFVIAMFSPNTRIFFFGSTAYTIYYVSFILLFLIVLLRWIHVIDDISIALIVGFISGVIALFFISKIINRINKNKP